MSWILGMIDRLFVVFGALVFSQAPLFMQQYTHQLSGHAAELHYQVQKLEAAAADSGKGLNEYIQKFSGNSDVDFAKQGRMMQGMVERWQSFDQALAALQQSTVVTRPFLFVAYFNSDVATATWKTFEYGLSFSMEGLAYALVGIVAGFLAFAILSFAVKGVFRLFIWKKSPAAAP